MISWAIDQLKFVWSYFCDGLVLGLLRHLPLIGSLLLLLGIVSFDLMGSFGIPLLFWHETGWKQSLAGGCVALAVVAILFEAYLLDTGRPGRYWQSAIPQGARKMSFRRRGKRTDQDQGPPPVAPATLVEAKIYLRAGVLFWLAAALIVGFVHGRFLVGGASVVDLSWTERLWLPIGFVIGWAIAAIGINGIFGLIERFEEQDAPKKTAFVWRSTEWVRLHFAVSSDDPNVRTTLRLRMLSGIVTIILSLIYILIAVLVRFSREQFVTPAAGLCLIIMLLCAGYTFVAIRTPARGAMGRHSLWSNAGTIVIVLILAMCVGGYPQRKIQFEGLDTYYGNPPSAYAAETTSIGNLGLVEPDEWLASAAGEEGRRHPLVIVCSSGGGIRAAVWAGAVLGQLDNSLEGFPYRVKLMTGASGGMLGNAYYACTMVPPRQAGPSRHSVNGVAGPYKQLSAGELVDNLAKDSLSSTVKQMLFSDLPLVVSPADRPPGKDRGGAMEGSWRLLLGNGFADATFGNMRAGEKAHWRPSLIFSPMMAEDGRRMLISNLDLDFMCYSGGHRLAPPLKDGKVTHFKDHDHYIYSQSAYDFAYWFPRSFDDFRISTAARMSASFPYVSTAGVLPTDDRRRVVDAGYYDNYGLTTATTWLIHCIDGYKTPRLEQFCSGVVIIQIRDSVSDLDGNHPNFNSAHDVQSSIFSRGWEWLTSSPSAYVAAGDSVSLFRNDLALEKLSQLFDDQGYPGNFFTTVQFDYSGGTLTWYLTKRQKEDILSAAGTMAAGNVTPGLSDRDQGNARGMAALKTWWAAHDGQSPRP